MKKLTRREVLQSLAGLSVLGSMSPGLRAAASTGTPISSTNSSTSGAHDHHVAAMSGDTTTTSATPRAALSMTQLSGAVGPTTVAAGTIAVIVGDVDLRGDLTVEGLLTGVDTFTLRGNGFQIEVRNGGQLDLRGIPKSGWVRGTAASGWRTEDRILTTPVGIGKYAPWDFHTGAPGLVKLADGRTIAAEQFNLTRSITIDNVSRIMFHMGAGRQVLKHLSVRNSGLAGKLAFYPIHFHLNGNSTRGSIVEGVVVENGRFHAFVPHASNGITFLDCVAFNTADEAFWWDPPPGRNDSTNDSHDIVWQHCLAAFVMRQAGSSAKRTTAFFLGKGTGNRCVDSTAVGVQGGMQTSGFHWPEGAAGVWEFRGCVAHNNAATGIFVWQNNADGNVIEDFIAYRCGRSGIEHGAYSNNYFYRNAVVTDAQWTVRQHAVSRDGSLIFQGVVGNNRLLVDGHQSPATRPSFYRSCRFAGVTYNELGNSGTSTNIFEDCDLIPGKFDLSGIKPGSIIEIREGGTLIHKWADGRWD